MLSGTQYMLQKIPCTHLSLLAFGILIVITVITELKLVTLCKEVQIRNGEMMTYRCVRIFNVIVMSRHVTSSGLLEFFKSSGVLLRVGKCLRRFIRLVT